MSIDVVAKIGGIFALLVLIHFVADWVFQSHAEAMAKPKNHWVRARHCLIYTVICCASLMLVNPAWYVIGMSAVILWLSHFMEDTYIPVFVWAKYIRKPGPMNNLTDFVVFAESTLGKILLIAIDQIVHLVFMLPVAIMVVSPQAFPVCSLVSFLGLGGLGALCVVGAKTFKLPWKLWLDDQLDEVPRRAVPEGYIGAKSTTEASLLIVSKGLPAVMDLDHDLGGEDTAMVFLKWLAEKFPNGPVPEYAIHSENIEGQKAIRSFLDSWKKSLTL